MWPYWLLFIVPAYLAVVSLAPISKSSNNSLKRQWSIGWWVVFFFVILIIGFRHKVGGDWESYLLEINLIVAEENDNRLNRTEPLFAVLYWVGARSGYGIYLVNVISAIFFSWGLMVFCQAQPRPWLALTVAVPYLITVVAMGYTRQGVAIGVAMLGMEALGRGRNVHFIFLIVFATMFHKSAIILLPIAWLGTSNRRIITMIWMMISVVLLFFLMIQEHVDSLIHGYLEDAMQSSGAVIRITMNAFPAAIFLIFRKRFQMSQNQKRFWTWMSMIGLLFIVLLMLSPSSTAVDRLALYWIPLQIFVFSRVPNALGLHDGKNTMWVYVVVIYSASVHFVWLFYADTAFAWLPYQFYPWVWLWQ
jgi:hypothetical protein